MYFLHLVRTKIHITRVLMLDRQGIIKSYVELHARQGHSEYIRGITYAFFMVMLLFRTSFCARITLFLLSNADQSPSFPKHVNNSESSIKGPLRQDTHPLGQHDGW